MVFIVEYQYKIHPCKCINIRYVCVLANACMLIYTFVVLRMCLYYNIQPHCTLDMFNTHRIAQHMYKIAQHAHVIALYTHRIA